MNIHQKLIEIRKSVDYIQKTNKGHQFNYVSSSQVLGAVRKRMDELGVLLVTEVLDKEVTMHDKAGKITYFTEIKTKMTWINAEKPDDKLEVKFYAQGVDVGSERGVGKAYSYLLKTFLLSQFNIATDSLDPDSFQEEAESNRRPAKITEDELEEIEGKVEELAKLQNVDRTAILKALKVKTLESITFIQYEAFMAQIDKWMVTAKRLKEEGAKK